jgi:hypothetical protein
MGIVAYPLRLRSQPYLIQSTRVRDCPLPQDSSYIQIFIQAGIVSLRTMAVALTAALAAVSVKR